MNHLHREKIWALRFFQTDIESVRQIATQIGISEYMAILLYNRGYRTVEEARKFLRFETADFHDPFLLRDVDLAIERIMRAVESREKIYIYGDYDVDGVTSVSMLYLYLTELGASVKIKIPKREGEGYGVSRSGVEAIAADGATLIITVDTGITAYDEVLYAKELGVDVVITDHHECRPDLPQAYAVINPHREDCRYPFCELAGVGVVFKLICALEIHACRQRGESALDGVRRICLSYADLAAIGTVADVMPLVDENRLIVSMGLRLVENTERPGLAALIEASTPPQKDGKAQKKRKITSGAIGYGIAPRINAAGRMSDAAIAVRLLLAQKEDEARSYAEELCEINRCRQVEENAIAEQAYAMIEQEHDLEHEKVLVLDHDAWHCGIIGIVASRITERYGLPSILISYAGAEDERGSDVGKGSGRSIKGMNLVGALRYCEDLLEKFGGHELAAGLSIRRENVPAFAERINEYAEQNLSEEAFRVSIEADCELPIEDITLALAEEIQLLEPFGVGNATPTFMMRDVTVQRVLSIGAGKHSKLFLEKDGKAVCGMYFGVAPSELAFDTGDVIDLLFHLDINDYKNQRSVQLILQDARISENYVRQLALEKMRFEQIRGGASFDEAEDVIPNRDDFALVYTSLRREYRNGVSVLDATSMRKLMMGTDGVGIGYVKLRYILEIMNELQICCIEQMDTDLFRFEVPFHAGKTSIEKSSILKKLKSQCADRHKA